MVHPRKDPARRCLKLAEWPDADQMEWNKARRPGSILLGGAGAASRWAPETVLKYRKGYGRWLNFLGRRGLLGKTETPVARITPERVANYIDELREQCLAPWTVRGRIAELLAVALAFTPKSDWSWLKRTLRYLDADAADARPKGPRMRPAHEILDWAIGVLDEVLGLEEPAIGDAVRFRDALVVAVLILCPILRRGNLADITIGKHLRRHRGGYVLIFEASETKTKRPFEAPLPPEFTRFVDLYLARFRPMLLGTRDSNRLWISWRGTAMSPMSLYHRITGATRDAFGTAISPHLFRDCAVTTVAVEDPTHIGIAPDILGHTSDRTTHRHYVQAKSLEASRRLRDTLDELRRSLPSPRAIARRRKNPSKQHSRQ